MLSSVWLSCSNAKGSAEEGDAAVVLGAAACIDGVEGSTKEEEAMAGGALCTLLAGEHDRTNPLQ
jgi:hypothetical protein